MNQLKLSNLVSQEVQQSQEAELAFAYDMIVQGIAEERWWRRSGLRARYLWALEAAVVLCHRTPSHRHAAALAHHPGF
ncbi:MAG: hypothetical protein IPM76_24360 [Chloroflexi bacterium]|nr:hypothetical protein [Chloroflexota bacterium]